jgi:hypothetical protein
MLNVVEEPVDVSSLDGLQYKRFVLQSDICVSVAHVVAYLQHFQHLKENGVIIENTVAVEDKGKVLGHCLMLFSTNLVW